ncbi:hypothetical protein LTR78_004853 [Recurvomyces mirabilis]|uniref:Cytidyltransferase-like domain-containing protein n=1 Tax=Recurvomyces mirabilis TaxID=574656 RepID=A0AAE0WP62_9PEZI|nr:hypothetical protein LTR78_004853 [Recurvomyces mirabilis]KAK5158024.1 hypothetical protein LTS14_003947 [Recurvomyces mirabilis]
MDDAPPRYVLFLPPIPSPPTLSSLKISFGDTISQVLNEVASHSSDSSEAAILEVALACPSLVGRQNAPRSSLYGVVQSSFAAVYKLVCVIAAKDGVNVEDRNGVDVRIIPVAWSGNGSAQSATHAGPIVTLETLAQSGRQWQYAFGVETDAGESMVKAFVAAKSGQASPVSGSSTSTSNQKSRMQKHCHVAVGGTFDHLHIGHKLLLTMTVFAVDDRPSGDRSATIGITGDQLLVNKKHAQVLESWADRQRSVQNFLDSILNFSSSQPRITTTDNPGPNGKSTHIHYPNNLVVKCTEIQDPFGPTITEEQISTLIISGETRSGGKAVNDKRKEKGWTELEVFEVDVLDAEDEGAEVKEGFGSKLSSTAIREKLARQTESVSTAGGRSKV